MQKMKLPRSIFEKPEGCIKIIDQNLLPFRMKIITLNCFDDFTEAINSMKVRGAPLIGVTAAYALYFALMQIKSDKELLREINHFADILISTRPTAVNLRWAVQQQLSLLTNKTTVSEAKYLFLSNARKLAEDDVQQNKSIGENGFRLIEKIYKRTQNPVNILTHCNAGSLATVHYGTALAPVYYAHERGIPLHVWVDETRPRNQGARLTAFELKENDVPHTVICDNTGGLLMQKGLVDLVITGADRVAANGDTANKIGTYLKALAAKDNKIPFFVALPLSTFDFCLADGKFIEIEERSGDEVRFIEGYHQKGVSKIAVCLSDSPVVNYGFDITPAKLITGFITEKGIFRTKEIQKINTQ